MKSADKPTKQQMGKSDNVASLVEGMSNTQNLYQQWNKKMCFKVTQWIFEQIQFERMLSILIKDTGMVWSDTNNSDLQLSQ